RGVRDRRAPRPGAGGLRGGRAPPERRRGAPRRRPRVPRLTRGPDRPGAGTRRRGAGSPDAQGRCESGTRPPGGPRLERLSYTKGMSDPVALFPPAVAAWFRETYQRPTPPQEQGWPVIAGGGHALVLAPTGSGKTLTAFLWAVDVLFREQLA